MAARSREHVLARLPGRRAVGRAGAHRSHAGNAAREMKRSDAAERSLRHSAVKGLALAFLASFLASMPVATNAAGPASYPNRPIHLIVPFTAGNQLDVFARLIGDRLAESMGQPVLVE